MMGHDISRGRGTMGFSGAGPGTCQDTGDRVSCYSSLAHHAGKVVKAGREVVAHADVCTMVGDAKKQKPRGRGFPKTLRMRVNLGCGSVNEP